MNILEVIAENKIREAMRKANWTISLQRKTA